MNHQQAMSQMGEALDYLCAMFPEADNTVSFDITDFGDNGARCPSFVAISTTGAGYTESNTPMGAVKRLLSYNRITTVEQYIRLKAAQ
jgi:hypothetical protein